MKIVKREHHQVISYFTYDIPEDEIIDEFESLENFQELVDSGDFDAIDFINNYDYDREDDWWTDRKGGYDVDYEIESE
jgi:hypothetical protein